MGSLYCTLTGKYYYKCAISSEVSGSNYNVASAVTTEQTYGGKHTEVSDMHSPHKYLASVTDL